MWQPSYVTHTTSSEDPGSLQAVVDGASQVPVSKEVRWEALLLCRPALGCQSLCHNDIGRGREDLVVGFDRESSTLFTKEKKIGS